MITYSDFKCAIIKLKLFLEEQEKLGDLARVISPSGTNVCEFGNNFVDAYIDLLALSLNDSDGWIAWHIWENKFGENKFKVNFVNNNGEKEDKIICNTKDIYDLICTLNKINNAKRDL